MGRDAQPFLDATRRLSELMRFCLPTLGIWLSAPMLSLIGSGEVTVDRPGGGSDTFHVAGGVLKVERDTVTLLTEYAGDEAPAEVPANSVVRLGERPERGRPPKTPDWRAADDA